MPTRSLLLPLVASVAFIAGVFAGRCTDVVDTVHPCVPDIAEQFEPTLGGWVDQYGHLVVALEYEDALPFCNPERN